MMGLRSFGRFKGVLLIGGMVVGLHTQALADSQKMEAFIQRMGDQVIAMLSNKSSSRIDREKAFLGILEKDFDIHSIGRFVLGKHYRGLSKDEQQIYLDRFKKSVARSYAIRFEAYENEAFNVQAGKTISPGKGKKNWKVFSTVMKPGKPQTEVIWSVVEKPGGPKVVDVVVEKVSMSATQRSDYAAVIERNGGGKPGVKALLDKLGPSH